jgi:AraC-like DNA-binding protein
MKDTHSQPEEIRFHNPQLGAVGIEVLHLSTLRRRVSTRHLAAPQRVEFFMLLFVAEGYLRHVVDFAELRLGAGSLLFVRPGQVQHWHLDERAQGCMVLIDPPALTPIAHSRSARDALLAAMADWPVGVRLDKEFAVELRAGLDCLARDLTQFDGTVHDMTLIRQGLLAVLLRVARWHRKRWNDLPRPPAGTQQVFRLFEAEIEQHFRSHRSVADYALRLGYSESTLNRACRAATAQSAKVLLDRRLAMEAARMLVHSPASVAEIGHALGFSEPTNFVRFFVRLVGSTPQKFRGRHTPGAPSATQSPG